MKKGEPNTFCSDIGKDNLPHEFECIMAAQEIGIEGFHKLRKPDSEFSAACFRKISDNTAYWNPADVGKRSTDAEPICGDNGNYTLACCIFS